jgi:bifunctional non-homologous end joining protein LigD
MERDLIRVEGKELVLSHLDKILFPQSQLHKADVLQYYIRIAPYLLPHLKNRPLSLLRFPNGIKESSFWEKEAPEGKPDWVPIWSHSSESRGDQIHWVVCNDLATLVWLVNLACIDFHPWFSRNDQPDYPDFVVFDLDPTPPAGFHQVLQVARLVKAVLDPFDLRVYLKTSGATGLHMYLPIQPRYSYKQVRGFAENVAALTIRRFPDLITPEWKISQRTGKVRIDFTQNVAGKTLASVYSMRPLEGAPVSCPLVWEELTDSLRPSSLNYLSIHARLERLGDLFAGSLEDRQNLDAALQALSSPV